MKHPAIDGPHSRKTAESTAANRKPVAAPPTQIGRVLARSPAPMAALTRMPTAIEMPSGTMNVSATHEIAIWWARERHGAQPRPS